MNRYAINKGVGRRVQIKGFDALFVGLLVGSMLVSFTVYGVLSVLGASLAVQVLAPLVLFLSLAIWIGYVSRRYGRRGLPKLMAGRRQVTCVVRRHSVGRLLADLQEVHRG